MIRLPTIAKKKSHNSDRSSDTSCGHMLRILVWEYLLITLKVICIILHLIFFSQSYVFFNHIIMSLLTWVIQFDSQIYQKRHFLRNNQWINIIWTNDKIPFYIIPQKFGSEWANIRFFQFIKHIEYLPNCCTVPTMLGTELWYLLKDQI